LLHRGRKNERTWTIHNSITARAWRILPDDPDSMSIGFGAHDGCKQLSELSLFDDSGDDHDGSNRIDVLHSN
jgi:hypothetical protein